MSIEASACAHCGRMLSQFEAAIGDSWVCQPNDPRLLDCYHLVTMHDEPLGACRAEVDG